MVLSISTSLRSKKVGTYLRKGPAKFVLTTVFTARLRCLKIDVAVHQLSLPQTVISVVVEDAVFHMQRNGIEYSMVPAGKCWVTRPKLVSFHIACQNQDDPPESQSCPI